MHEAWFCDTPHRSWGIWDSNNGTVHAAGKTIVRHGLDSFRLSKDGILAAEKVRDPRSWLYVRVNVGVESCTLISYWLVHVFILTRLTLQN